jgi:hypothetical protein
VVVTALDGGGDDAPFAAAEVDEGGRWADGGGGVRAYVHGWGFLTEGQGQSGGVEVLVLEVACIFLFGG